MPAIFDFTVFSPFDYSHLISLDDARQKALQDIRNIRGLVDNDPIPTFLDEETDIEMVKIHCDWLKDK